MPGSMIWAASLHQLQFGT